MIVPLMPPYSPPKRTNPPARATLMPNVKIKKRVVLLRNFMGLSPL